MNAKSKSLTTVFLSGVLLAAMISCNNPAGPGTGTLEEESSGIDSDPAAGLVANIPLEGDAILTHPDVVVSDGVTWAAGLSGNAMRGDEDGDYLRITDGSLPELTMSGTVELWIYPESPDGEDNNWAGILHKGDQIDFSDEAWSLQYQNTEKIMFNYHYDDEGANRYKSVTASRVLDEGAWHHIAVAWNYDEAGDETSLALYLDGAADTEITYSGLGPMIDSDGDLIVGSQLPVQYSATYGHLTFMGLIDEISVYDHVRTAAEIDAAYQAYASDL